MKKISLKTDRKEQFVNITRMVSNAVEAAGIKEGICVVYNPHTTAGVTINEAADPDVVTDMLAEFKKIVPDHDNYKHLEGNSSSHIKATIVGNSSTIPVQDGKLILGTWQGIYFCEFDGPRSRNFIVQCIGTDK